VRARERRKSLRGKELGHVVGRPLNADSLFTIQLHNVDVVPLRMGHYNKNADVAPLSENLLIAYSLPIDDIAYLDVLS